MYIDKAVNKCFPSLVTDVRIGAHCQKYGYLAKKIDGGASIYCRIKKKTQQLLWDRGSYRIYVPSGTRYARRFTYTNRLFCVVPPANFTKNQKQSNNIVRSLRLYWYAQNAVYVHISWSIRYYRIIREMGTNERSPNNDYTPWALSLTWFLCSNYYYSRNEWEAVKPRSLLRTRKRCSVFCLLSNAVPGI